MVLQAIFYPKKQVNDHFLTDRGQNLREIGQEHQKVASEQLFFTDECSASIQINDRQFCDFISLHKLVNYQFMIDTA